MEVKIARGVGCDVAGNLFLLSLIKLATREQGMNVQGVHLHEIIQANQDQSCSSCS